MMKLRTSYWYARAFLQKYKRLFFFGVVLGFAVVWLFPRFLVLLPQTRETVFIGRVGLYTWTDLPRDIQEKMSVGLTSLNEQGEPIPTLAERWSVEEDGRAFRFLLKDNLRWQDGKALTPQDIDYNFADVQVVRTEREILFRLAEPYAPFPTTVTAPLFRQIQTKRLGIFPHTQVIGLGEYRVLNVVQKGGVIRELSLQNQRQRIVYRFYTSETEALAAFRHGKVDMLEKLTGLSDLSEQERQVLKIEENLSFQQYVVLLLNTADPNLTKEVRQALHYATRKPDVDSPRLRALSPIAPTSWAYNDTSEVNAFTLDMSRAVELYTQSNPQQPLQLTLDTALSLLPDAQQIAQDWQALGEAARAACLRAPARATDGQLPDSATDCGRFAIAVSVRVAPSIDAPQALLIGREIPPDPDQYAWWHSTQQGNIANYQNARVDKLLEDARKETDQAKRKVLYLEIQRYLVEDVPAMFLYYLPDYTVARRNRL